MVNRKLKAIFNETNSFKSIRALDVITVEDIAESADSKLFKSITQSLSTFSSSPSQGSGILFPVVKLTEVGGGTVHFFPTLSLPLSSPLLFPSLPSIPLRSMSLQARGSV